jgi:hypothetical protein
MIRATTVTHQYAMRCFLSEEKKSDKLVGSKASRDQCTQYAIVPNGQSRVLKYYTPYKLEQKKPPRTLETNK